MIKHRIMSAATLLGGVVFTGHAVAQSPEVARRLDAKYDVVWPAADGLIRVNKGGYRIPDSRMKSNGKYGYADTLGQVAHAKTLFATHYHELNEMEQMCPRVKNYHVSVKELGNQIVFLRKLERGGTEHSFGIHVARMAGMPMSVVSRADEILRNLELVYGNNEIVPSRSLKSRGKKPSPSVREAAEAGAPQNMQLSMFQLDDPVLVQIRDQIKGLDIDSLTPIEALNKLNEIKKITGI